MSRRKGSRTPSRKPVAKAVGPESDTVDAKTMAETTVKPKRHHRDPLAWLGAHIVSGWHAFIRMWHRPGSWHRPLLIAVELLASAVGAPFLAGLVTDLLVGDWSRKVGACGMILLLWILVGNIRGMIRKHREHKAEDEADMRKATHSDHSRRGARK